MGLGTGWVTLREYRHEGPLFVLFRLLLFFFIFCVIFKSVLKSIFRIKTQTWRKSSRENYWNLTSGRREMRGQGVLKEGGKEMPARTPLFSPSHLLIMYVKIAHLWMTSCQISLAVMHLFLTFVFLKQEIWSEGTSIERRKLQQCVTLLSVACMVGVLGQTADIKYTGSMIFPFFPLVSKPHLADRSFLHAFF